MKKCNWSMVSSTTKFGCRWWRQLNIFFQSVWHYMPCGMAHIGFGSSWMLSISARSVSVFQTNHPENEESTFKNHDYNLIQIFCWYHKWSLWHSSSLMILFLLFSAFPSFGHFDFKFCNKETKQEIFQTIFFYT